MSGSEKTRVEKGKKWVIKAATCLVFYELTVIQPVYRPYVNIFPHEQIDRFDSIQMENIHAIHSISLQQSKKVVFTQTSNLCFKKLIQQLA